METALIVAVLVAVTTYAIVRMVSNPEQRQDSGSPVLSALDEVFNPAAHRANKEREKEHVLPVEHKQSGGVDPETMTVELKLPPVDPS